MQYHTLTDNTLGNRMAMIKHLKYLTRLLGKLGISCLVRNNSPWLQQQNDYPKYFYGYGLKESKDFVDAYLDRKAKQENNV